MVAKNGKIPIIVGLGEVLWDVFEDCEVFGGAPANFACHAAGLGCQVFMVSAVGHDELGDRAVQSLGNKGVGTQYLRRLREKETGRVCVRVNSEGQPRYEIKPDVAWDGLIWQSDLEWLAKNCDAVCFGTLGQRDKESRQTIVRFLKSTKPDCLRVFDVNIRQRHYSDVIILDSLRLANVVKLNDDELDIVCSVAGIDGGDTAEKLKELSQKFELQLVAMTAGSLGSVLYSNGKLSHHKPSGDIAVRDTVGAGDAFAATAVYGYLHGWGLEAINEFANKVAGYVCTQTGATPELPENLLNMIQSAGINGDAILPKSSDGQDLNGRHPHFDRQHSSQSERRS